MGKDESNSKKSWEDLFWKSHNYNDRQKIKSGAYLHSFCPHCDAEITDGNVLSIEVVNENGEIGKVELSPYLNTYERQTRIQLQEGVEVQDIRCPFCHKSFKVDGKKCGLGDSHVASFLIGISNSKVPFFICMRVGCPWHAIEPEDESKILLDGSDEW